MSENTLILKAIRGHGKFGFLSLDKIIEDIGPKIKYLQTPTNLPHAGALGFDACVIQAIVQWTRNSPQGVLTLFPNSNIEQFLNTTHGFVGYCINDRIENDGKRIQPNLAFEYTAKKRKGISSRAIKSIVESSFKGQGVDLICHGGRETRFPDSIFEKSFIYSGDPSFDFVRNPAHFGGILESVLGTFFSRKNSEFVVDLSVSIVELIKNAEEYGHKDQNQVALDQRSDVSGVLIRKRKVQAEIGSSLLVAQGDRENHQLYKYFPSRVGKSSTYIEISVFDTGPGLAAHFLKKPISEMEFEDEQKAAITCLEKWATTQPKGVRKRGRGLWDVLDYLRKHNGLFRLRTGRVSLFFAFHESYQNGNLSKIINEEFHAQECPELVGTSITLLVPIE